MLPVLLAAGLLAGCGDKSGGSSTESKLPDAATQPEANAAVFQRSCDSINTLIERKQYKEAQEALEVFKKLKLTPEQEKVIAQMRSRIPKTD